MKRLIALAIALVAVCCATFGLYRWDTQYRFYSHSGWMKVHYLLHKEAFERLSDELSEDPLIEAVWYDPPGSLQRTARAPLLFLDPAEQESYDKRNDEIEAQQSRYEPFLADLKFPGTVVFHRNEKDPRLTDNFGPTDEFGYVLMQSWLIHADGIDTFKVPCPSKPLDLPSGDCAERLGGDWWMRYSWFTRSPDE